MRTYEFVTLDVFTDRRFGGNPLAVFPDAQGLTTEEMQAIGSEFNLSEVTFVLPPKDPANTAQVRIFTPTLEMPFAGHPNVGTGYVLAQAGRDTDGRLRFEEIAGLVEIEISRASSGAITSARIAAPLPLELGPYFPAEQIASLASLALDDMVVTGHAPVQASVGAGFIIAEVTPEALTRATPDLVAFRALAAARPDLHIHLHLYAVDGSDFRTRMFAPMDNIYEDAATGSANAALAALRLSLTGDQTLHAIASQGVEMGRPSRLEIAAHRATDGIRATVAGTCVPVMRGVLEL